MDNNPEISTTPNIISTANVRNALKQYFGFEQFKGYQEQIIMDLLKGNDVFVLMPTGGGKSLCYQLPALLMPGTTIVISPLIALMKNQVDAMRQFCGDPGVAHFLNSSLTKAAIEDVKEDVRSGRTKLLYVAPESLTKEENINFLRSVRISFYAVDEAHCISEWGHDFRPEYRKIRPIINEIQNRPVIALTATATPKVQHDIQKNLGMTEACVFKSSFNRQNLYYEVRPKTKEIDREIIKYIKAHPGESGIIYCLSRKKVEELAETLRVNDIRVLPYHAGMDSATRTANQDDFLLEKVDVIVATIAFGMGIDKPDVRFVMHYDIPKSLEGYYQETGRAGRDGGRGHCICFYSRKDLQKMEKLLQGKPVSEQEIGKQLLEETAGYAESTVCRRRMLLHYFGEEFSEDNCGACDNCTHPKIKIEAGEELISTMETILAVGQKFKADYIVTLLIGRCTDEVRSRDHNELEEFGCAKHREDKFLHALIRQALIAGYIERDVESYGILRVTRAGHEFLKHPGSFKITEDNTFNDIDTPDESAHGGGVADTQLFAILKSLRKDEGRRLGLPPYVIFQDPSLEAMATTYPVTMQELQTIPGVGAGKARKFGNKFVELIAKYVEENEIDRPTDMRVRTIPNKSKMKISIIQAIDRKIDLEELAQSKGLKMPELLTEIESIIEAGTRLNLDYYLDDIIEPERQDEFMDWFTESQEDDIDAAYEEFGDDYTDEEIRLMRIKFISEMGN
ncbi:MAG: DNA helicase RecQ [Prevotella sp.]|nr:DNA helicase RecQ [Prevotella sp.]MCM1075180.1 DNA helicase RecQ [Ruminococcus sp.]